MRAWRRVPRRRCGFAWEEFFFFRRFLKKRMGARWVRNRRFAALSLLFHLSRLSQGGSRCRQGPPMKSKTHQASIHARASAALLVVVTVGAVDAMATRQGRGAGAAAVAVLFDGSGSLREGQMQRVARVGKEENKKEGGANGRRGKREKRESGENVASERRSFALVGDVFLR